MCFRSVFRSCEQIAKNPRFEIVTFDFGQPVSNKADPILIFSDFWDWDGKDETGTWQIKSEPRKGTRAMQRFDESIWNRKIQMAKGIVSLPWT